MLLQYCIMVQGEFRKGDINDSVQKSSRTVQHVTGCAYDGKILEHHTNRSNT